MRKKTYGEIRVKGRHTHIAVATFLATFDFSTTQAIHPPRQILMKMRLRYIQSRTSQKMRMTSAPRTTVS
jgi:hypothetical protein